MLTQESQRTNQSNSPGTLSVEARDRIAQLQIFAKGIVDGLTVGRHRSPHKGFSAEFKEHRPYVAGDEIRSIDWKLFGKTDRLFIRQYEEETNLKCTILVDQSKSMSYRSPTAKMLDDNQTPVVSKHQYAVQLAAALSYLLISQQDAVGVGLVDTDLHQFITPKSRPNHLQAILQTLASSQCAGETKLSNVLERAAPRIRGRGIVVLISDAFDDVESLLKALSFYRVGRSETILFQIFDRDEVDFPFRQRTEFRDLEVASVTRRIDPSSLRRLYLERVAKFRKELEEGCAKQRIDLVRCITDQSLADILSDYIVSRGRSR